MQLHHWKDWICIKQMIHEGINNTNFGSLGLRFVRINVFGELQLLQVSAPINGKLFSFYPPPECVVTLAKNSQDLEAIPENLD